MGTTRPRLSGDISAAISPTLLVLLLMLLLCDDVTGIKAALNESSGLRSDEHVVVY